ncbi:hypothetical protein [Desulfosporosinus sp.]|uniref:hypothetical protein n=1 Tax=Desulfosporosinus sp. TaxID=157907 RepID=UPI00260AE5AB|nr:hypothetical protein [Desulfosporosinus sp.]
MRNTYVSCIARLGTHAIDQTDCLDRAELPDGSRITANWPPLVRYPTSIYENQRKALKDIL